MTSSPSTSTSSRGSRLIGVAAAALVAVTIFYAFVVTAPDAQLGETVRIMYVHVPTVITAYLATIVCAIASGYYLWKRSSFADLLAASAAEIGLVFLGLALITGSLWGRPTWGAYWVWDARLTTTALLFLMIVGYVTVRGLPSEPRARGTRSAVIALVTVSLIPVVHKSVEWWDSLHQGPTVLGGGDTNLAGTQAFALFVGMVAALTLAGWLLMHRFRVGWLTEQAEEAASARALDERRGEAGDAGTAGAPA